MISPNDASSCNPGARCAFQWFIGQGINASKKRTKTTITQILSTCHFSNSKAFIPKVRGRFRVHEVLDLSESGMSSVRCSPCGVRCPILASRVPLIRKLFAQQRQRVGLVLRHTDYEHMDRSKKI